MRYWMFHEISCITLITATLFPNFRSAMKWIAGVAACVAAFVIGGAILQ